MVSCWPQWVELRALVAELLDACLDAVLGLFRGCYPFANYLFLIVFAIKKHRESGR